MGDSSKFKYNPGDRLGPKQILMTERIRKKPNGLWEGKFIRPLCGKEFINELNKIVQGNTKSCGCGFQSNHEGEKYPYYEVLEKTEKRKTDHVVYKCLCHCGNYFEVPSNLIGKTWSCGCLQSKGEAKLKSIFQENNITYISQKQYPTCTYNGNKLRFDFYLPQYDVLIEYDGSLHFQYQQTERSWNNSEKLQETQVRDKAKDEWCQQNQVHLIRISYMNFNTMDINFINKCIEEALNNDTYVNRW